MTGRYFSCAYNKANGEKCVKKICAECERYRYTDCRGVAHCKCSLTDCESCEDYISNSEARAAKKAESWCSTCTHDCKKPERISFCSLYADKYEPAAPPDFRYCEACIHTCKRGGWCPNFSVKGV